MGASAIALAQQLLRVDTTSAIGAESKLSRPLARRLQAAGADVSLIAQRPGREGLVARWPGRDEQAPALCFCGHLDVVPIGSRAWSHEPFAGELGDGMIWGRGAADMKGGVAAMVTALEAATRRSGSAPGLGHAASSPRRPLVLALTVGEEVGCVGARSLLPELRGTGAIVLGEATANRVAIGHKGVVQTRLRASGRAAHAATPELGTSAIDTLIEVLRRLHALTGGPGAAQAGEEAITVNVGTISGGTQVNMVADAAEAMVDVRFPVGVDPAGLMAKIEACADVAGAGRVSCETTLALAPIRTAVDDPWVGDVVTLAGGLTTPANVSYFTDAAVLTPALGNPPTVILGPGDVRQAHQRDECCAVAAIDTACEIYEQLAGSWSGQRSPKTTPPGRK